MLNVVCAVPRLPYPPLAGGEIRVLSLMRALSRRCKFSLLTFLEPEWKFELAAAAAALRRQHGIDCTLVPRSLPPPKAPPDAPALAAPYWDPAMAQALRLAIARQKADLVQLEFSQMAHYAADAAALAPIVLTEHDASTLTPEHSYVRPWASPRGEAALMARYLKRTLASCAAVVVVSPADGERLRDLACGAEIAVVPTGVDLDAFAYAPSARRAPRRAVFVGHYPHYPNEDAAVFLCREVLPALRSLVPDAGVDLIGSHPTPKIRALAGRGVRLIGTVPDVAVHLQRAQVFIAPMRLGFGIKGKILEAFACGAPVVATPQSCEAMPGIVDGVHALLGRTAEDLAAAAARVMTDARLRAAMAAAARAYVEERFGWTRQAEKLLALYERLARTGARTAPAAAS